MLKKQIISFLIVGIINTFFGYALYAFFIKLGFNYVIAVTFATILGILFNFKTIGKYVFQSHHNKLIIKFFGVYIIVYVVNVFIITIFRMYGYNDYIAGFIALFPAASISFILNKYYVFKG